MINYIYGQSTAKNYDNAWYGMSNIRNIAPVSKEPIFKDEFVTISSNGGLRAS